MNYNVYSTGFCKNNGQPSQIAGAGIVLKFKNDGELKSRELGFHLGSVNAYLSEIQTARLCLASIPSSFRSIRVNLFFSSQYVPKMLEIKNGDFIAEPVKSVDDVIELRHLFKKFSDIRVYVADKKDENIKLAKSLAKKAMESEEEYDSGTLY